METARDCALRGDGSPPSGTMMAQSRHPAPKRHRCGVVITACVSQQGVAAVPREGTRAHACEATAGQQCRVLGCLHGSVPGHRVAPEDKSLRGAGTQWRRQPKAPLSRGCPRVVTTFRSNVQHRHPLPNPRCPTCVSMHSRLNTQSTDLCRPPIVPAVPGACEREPATMAARENERARFRAGRQGVVNALGSGVDRLAALHAIRFR